MPVLLSLPWCFTRFCKDFTKSRKAFHMFRYKNNYTNDGILVLLLLTLNNFTPPFSSVFIVNFE